MRKLLTTLLLTLNYLKQSNLSVKIVTTYLLPLTTYVRIRVFIYNVCTNYYIYV